MNGVAGKTPWPERLLAFVLLLGVCLWLVRNHWEQIDLPKQSHKLRLHAQVLENQAPDPYQYKLWLISLAFQEVSEVSGRSVPDVFFVNTLLSLVFLVFAHDFWLRGIVGGRTALVGGILLGALAHVLFLTYYHHPYEFWGVGMFCILLRGIHHNWSWITLCVLALVTGLVWEKHALLAFLWGLYALTRGRPFLPSLGRGIVMLAAALAAPLLLRWHLGTEGRVHVDGDTALAIQEWTKIAWFQVPYVAPFLLVFLARFRWMPVWLRLLWIYLPTLVLAYAVNHYILHEVRSFWALAPVFTATTCCWLASSDPNSGDDAAEGGQSAGPQSCHAAP